MLKKTLSIALVACAVAGYGTMQAGMPDNFSLLKINQQIIAGTVLDQSGRPVSGATVTNLKNNQTAVTDKNGRFQLNGEVGDAISISHAGFQTFEGSLAAGANRFQLEPAMKERMIDEVAISIGYQKIRKSDATGAISNIKAEELNLTAPNVTQAMVGKVSGVQVLQTSGAPYDGAKMRVRGIGSINANSDPLYVVDGYPVSDIKNLNSDDIASIDILKDAASAAIYGSRAAGGVVLITTRRGREGRNTVEYEIQNGFGQLAKKVKLLNADQFIDLLIDGRNNAYHDLVLAKGMTWNDNMKLDANSVRVANVGNAATVSIPTQYYDFATGKAKPSQYNTDWQDALYRLAPFQRHNVTFSGGNENIRYLISGNYKSQDGIMLNTGQEVFNFRANVDAKFSNKFSVGANIAFTDNRNKEVTTGRYDHSPSMAALIYLPTLPVYNADGSFAQYQMANLAANNYGIQNPENPLAYVSLVKNERKGRNSMYNAFAKYSIIDGLDLKFNGGYTTYNEKYDFYQPTSISSGNYAPYSDQAKTAAYALANNNTTVDKLLEITLNYYKTFGRHNINALLGYSAQRTDYDFLGVYANGFQTDAIEEITNGGADPSNFQLVQNATFKRTTTLLSYFSRLSYNYDSRYYLSASIRTDGSSRFGVNSKWGTFPSFSAGWTISNESFYNNWLGAKSSLKLRASWGLSGNNNIGDYRSQTVFNAPGGAIINNRVQTAYWPAGLYDQNLSWETTSQYNAGLDLGLLNKRINIMTNFYLSRSYDLLFNQPITSISGTTSILTNLPNSKVQNKGFDFQLDASIIRHTDFDLGFSGNINVNRNKVLDLGGASTILTNGAERSYMTHITQAGSPIGMFYGFKVLGIATAANYKTLAPSASSSTPLQPGDLYFEDVNHDGIVNDKDKQIIGNPYPKFTYGFAVNARYKNVDMRASFNGSYGNQVLDGQDYYLYNMEGSGNNYADVNNRWRSPDNPGNGSVYRASRGSTQSNSTRLSSFYLQDGSYLRMTNINIGYTFSKDLIHKISLSALRFYASVDNAFTITKYKGYNPEPDYNQRGNLTPGVDYGLYPLVRTYSVGLKVTF